MKNFERMKGSKQREKYIVNGKRFSSYEEVEDYCEKEISALPILPQLVKVHS